ncbi:hypothetical protein AAEX28_09430 [Lentisphaerota bacterium WC36G]|nr:hypothetical protein LJT99_12270 [Lentisphaerae bacterium WC36]
MYFARIAFKLKDYEKAEKLYQRAIKTVNCGSEIAELYLEQKKYDKVIEYYEKEVAKNKFNYLNWPLFNIYKQQNKYQDIIRICDQAINYYEKNLYKNINYTLALRYFYLTRQQFLKKIESQKEKSK